MRLARLQQAFQAYVLAGDPAIRECIAATAGVDADARLAIYADAYRLRLIEALATDYPGLKAVAGDEQFDRLGRAYLDTHPSRVASLRWFGHQLATYLRTTAPWCDHPALAEMAAFEWAMSDAFDAEDSMPATVNDLATIPPDHWPRLRFTLHASVQRLDLRWNVPTVWQAVDTGTAPPPLAAADHPTGWLVWRHRLVTHFRSLTVDEAWALDALRRGDTFAAVCDGLCEWIDTRHVAAHAAALLKRWLEDGVVRDVGTD